MNNPSLVYQAKSFYNAYIALEQLKTDDELLLLVHKLVNGAFSVDNQGYFGGTGYFL